MKKLLPLLTLAALLLVGCEAATNSGTQTPDQTTAATTTAPVTTLDRDTLANPEAYSELKLKAVKAVWEASKGTVKNDLTINHVAILSEIYEYDEAIVCMAQIGSILMSSPGHTEEAVLDYEFRYGDSDQYKVYANCKEYSLSEAYTAGVLTEDEIRSLWEAHKAANSIYYEEDFS